ncbi:SCF ubiquitin ligase complex subunit [Saccharomycopsis crataegensis]|uniref:SCF ubiquitin ligase complex subunit n=1 Tax=Saccharomycopsis crataegensis TaxID=43959 RepID=A0AAV5QNB5_9ASCO|nr:SCF ubiquitin ligase complex subunit [Saccharomycopsis crataegensis]
MTSNILSLGEDIIMRHLLPQLDYDDIVQLSKVPNHDLHQMLQSSYFYQVLFQKQFGDDSATPWLSSTANWHELYKLRLSSHLYTWGDNERGRLGHTRQDLQAPRFGRFYVSTPTEVKSFLSGDITDSHDITMVDVCAGGFTFHVLTGENNIFTIGYQLEKDPGTYPREPDYNPLIEFYRRQENRIPRFGGHYVRRGPVNIRSFPPQSSEPHDTNPWGQIPANEFYSPAALAEIELMKSKKPTIKLCELPRTPKTKNTKIIGISSGRTQFIALDNRNQIWTWDTGDQEFGIRLKFINPTTKKSIIKDSNINRITKISAGWGISSCFVFGVGIVLWNTRDPIKKEDSPDIALNANYRVISGTGETHNDRQVVDYFIGDGFLLYITSTGKLYRMDISPEMFDSTIQPQPFEVLSFNEHLSKTTLKSGTGCRFVKISGTFCNFAVFTNDDQVLIGDRDSINYDQFDFENRTCSTKSKPQILPELQYQKCINISMGDYHFMALFKDGSMASWGLESQSCGSLGLGNCEEINEKFGPNTAVMEGNWRDMRVTKPQRISLPNNKVALAIAASGWHSSAIIATKK